MRFNYLLGIRHTFMNSGLLKGYIVESEELNRKTKHSDKIKIRKGLPDQLPIKVQKLVQYALLHDFYHTSKHKSKIYVEPELTNTKQMELLRQHHNKLNNTLIQIFQHYDKLAAQITRKFRSPRTNRYNWYAKKIVDFSKLAKEIAEVADHPWKLYEYIYQSRELKHLTESLQHGHTSLQTHLLIMTNLIVQDYLCGRLSLCTSNESEYRCQHK